MRISPPSGLRGISLLSLAAVPLVARGAFGLALGGPAAPEREVIREPIVLSAPDLSAPEPGFPSTSADSGTPGAVGTPADAALEALSVHVSVASHPGALGAALGAYFAYRDTHPERVRNPYLYYVDLGLDNLTPRGYVFDMESLKLVEGPFPVAHGRGSSPVRDGVPERFSNVPGSNASSLGLYLAGETYGFSGRSGGKPYTSVGLRMLGESGSFNDAALTRGIVAHGAPYVTRSGAGRSEGCPAMEQSRAERLLPLLAEGGVVFLYSPNDDGWLAEDPWIQAARP